MFEENCQQYTMKAHQNYDFDISPHKQDLVTSINGKKEKDTVEHKNQIKESAKENSPEELEDLKIKNHLPKVVIRVIIQSIIAHMKVLIVPKMENCK
ncbi:hypothetical protein JTB14_028095 [Gonioctena quinquepunctata]|nr:hypothetical protein JTB14_028095 [Gonioctena quinquepunctata]